VLDHDTPHDGSRRMPDLLGRRRIGPDDPRSSGLMSESLGRLAAPVPRPRRAMGYGRGDGRDGRTARRLADAMASVSSLRRSRSFAPRGPDRLAAVLIAGATSPVGRETVDRLRQLGIPATTLAPLSQTKVPEPRRPIASTLREVGTLVLAEPPQTRADARHLEDLIRRAAESEVQRVICVSSAGAVEGMYEFRIERAVEAAGLPMVVLRPAMLLQTLSEEHRSEIRADDILRLPVGPLGLAMIDAADVADVVALAVTDPPARMSKGGTFTLTGGAVVSSHDVAECLSRHLGRRVRTLPLPFRQYRRTLVASGRPLDAVHARLLQNAAMRASIGGRVIDMVEGFLGRPPATLEDYVVAHRCDWLP
jgi:uncharacterized protein YbjT (DUF2867 family)